MLCTIQSNMQHAFVDRPSLMRPYMVASYTHTCMHTVTRHLYLSSYAVWYRRRWGRGAHRAPNAYDQVGSGFNSPYWW